MGGRRRWLGAGLSVGVLGIIGVVAVWLSLSHSTNPDYQARNERSAIGEYFVNVWVDPHPAAVGQSEITVQLTSIIGTAFEPTELDLELQSPSGEATNLDVVHQMGDGSREHMYSGLIELDESGAWDLTVHYSLGGPVHSETFNISVEGP